MAFFRALAFWGLAIWVLIAGCEDECPTRSCPEQPVEAAVSGRIDAGGLPYAGQFEARRLTGSFLEEFRAFAYPDTSGQFRLGLPYGNYILSLRIGSWSYGDFRSRVHYYITETGMVLHSSEADTFTLNAEQDHLELDLVAGALEVRISTPPSLEGASVTLYPEHIGFETLPYRPYHWTSVSGSAEDGQVILRMPAFAPGECRLRVVLDEILESREQFYLPRGHRIADAHILTIVAGETTTYAVGLNESPAILSGSITGSWQAMGTTSPEVTLFDSDSSLVASGGLISPRGEFEFALYDPTPVRVRVDIAGSSAWIGGESFVQARVFDLAPGTSIGDADLVESGILFELQQLTYQRASYFTINLYDAVTLELYRSVFYDSSIRGLHACLPNISPGSYVAQFENTCLQTDWISQWVDRAETPWEAQTIVVSSAGECQMIPVHFEEGGRISGQIFAPADDFCPAPVIYVVDAEAGTCIGRTGCTATCASSCICLNPNPYLARGIPDGDYKVGTSIDVRTFDVPEDVVWYPGTTDFEAAEAVTVRAGELLSGIDIHFPD